MQIKLIQIKKVLEIGVGIVLVIFAGAFLYHRQYFLSLITLVLLLGLLRFRQVKRVKINTKEGVTAEFKNK